MVKSRPKILLSAAMSIDGKIATISGESKISSKNDLRRVHKLRSQVDAILVGKKTIENDDPLLTVRYVKGENPSRIILNSSGNLSTKFKIFKTAKKIPTIFVCSKKISKKNFNNLEKLPLEIISIGNDNINLKKLLYMLYKKNIKSILLEGGGTTNWEFIKQNLVDEIFITISPRIIGGKNSISLVDGKGFSKISNTSKFHLKKINRLKDELVLHYTKL